MRGMSQPSDFTVHTEAKQPGSSYEAPTLVELGTLHELTLTGCRKWLGKSDGFLWGAPIACVSP